MAQSLSFIRENPHGGRTEPLHKRLPHATHLAGKGSTRGSKISESHWDDFLMNPHNWWDARLGKVNPRQPDFIHKESNQGLWLRESSPSQVLLSLEDSVFCQKLEQLDTDKQKVSIFANNLWDDLLSNPGNWVDIRNSKTKTNRPDFKHKISGDALWIGKTTPLPVTLALETPDFCEKLIKGKTGTEEFWKDLIDNPDRWWDNRSKKTNPRAPDFKHKETGEGLWLDSSPDWARSKFTSAVEDNSL